MKYLIRQITRIWVTIGLFFYFKWIRSNGKENIPKKGAVLFISNHQNALLDPLLIITNIWWRRLNVLTRSSVFKEGIINYLFTCYRMLPIYRVRDGRETLKKNDAIFEKCYQLMADQEQLLIFAEGNHGTKKQVRPLKNGFIRIIEGTLSKYPDTEITIVPVGLNYSSITNYPSAFTVNYGTPLSANELIKQHNAEDLKKILQTELTKLTVHIDSEKYDYDNAYNYLVDQNCDFQNPAEAQNLLAQFDKNTTYKTPTHKQRRNIFYYLTVINSIIPWLLWKKLEKGVKDPAFKSTFRWGLGFSLYPLFYIIQTVCIYFIFNLKTAAYYLIICLLLGIFSSKLVKTSNIN